MKIEIPTSEEDAVTHAAALDDPDNLPLNDHELSLFKRRGKRVHRNGPQRLALDTDVILAFHP
ncbi:MAG: hypothetical protein HQL58_14075 [Magnetococcales bacterium]|nr:hypothetical protein [Magnetococcales bacterium]